jgi:hypothetical protein
MSGIVYTKNAEDCSSSSRSTSSDTSNSTTSSDHARSNTLETHRQKFMHLRSTGKGKKKQLPARLLRHTRRPGLWTLSDTDSSSSSEEEVLMTHRDKRAKLGVDAWASFSSNEVARTEERSRYGSAETDKEEDWRRTSRRPRRGGGASLMHTR